MNTDVRTLDVGTKFYVSNGGWSGEIIEVNGVKHMLVVDTGKAYNLTTRNDEDCMLDIATEQDRQREHDEYWNGVDSEGVLYGADANCYHQVEAQWSGVKCVKCGGWYCA